MREKVFLLCQTKKLCLYTPPPPVGDVYMRGEDRCQINVDASACNSMRACNDLGYLSSGLKKKGFNTFLKDYQGENHTNQDLFVDIKNYQPDVIFISTTNGSYYYDLKLISEIKQLYPNIIFILKGAIFFNIEFEFFEEADLSDIDYLVGGECEFIVPKLVYAIFFDEKEIEKIEGICYKKDGKWHQNKLINFDENLDDLPFPDRSAMNNNLYINPDTNKPLATIATSRGCPFNCIYCLSPVISGKKVRKRSTNNVLDELKDCYFNHNIDNFFFKADTFTADKEWCIDLCKKIINSELNGKISWVANSRVHTIDEEIIILMKQAGCNLIAFGFESGSEESLKLMKKNTTLEMNLTAAKLCKKHGMKMFGHFLIGLPWESAKHMADTKKHIFEIDADYIEVSVAIPFLHTELFNLIEHDKPEKVNEIKVLGRDSFKNTLSSTKYLSAEEVQFFRKDILKSFYFRPSYILKKIVNKKLTFGILMNYIKYGFKLLKNILLK
ncbi:MAG: B12-binding domain-containing radical SAM protein [Candidatus Gastranaerophilaceae bacterium]